MTKVSVIVPIYNVYDYLDKCLNSLVNQTLDDYEVICVNDGSPDNSFEIVDKYLAEYPNIIKSFKKENGGLSDARNYGIEKASGDYIAFVDGDDYVTLDYLEQLYNKAISSSFDVAVCDINYVYPDKEIIVSSEIKHDILDKKDVKKSMIGIYPAAWNKLYKKSLFSNGVRFKKGVWFEDVEFLYRLFPYICSIGKVDKPLINYVQRDGAITKTFDKRLYNYIDNFNGIIDFYKKNEFYDEYCKELEYSYVRYLYATFISQATNFDKDEFNKAYKEAKKNVKKYFPKYRLNTYFYCSLKGLYLVCFCKFLANTVYYLKNRR